MKALIQKGRHIFQALLKNPLPKKHLGVFLLFVFVGVFGYTTSVHAEFSAEAIATYFGNGIINIISELVLFLTGFLIKFTVFFLAFFLKLAAYNGFIDAPVVIIGWTMVRDIANMFFVVILLVIAFGTILGLDQYEWKRTMAKFLVAAVLINFSRTICGLILDAAHVFTMTFLNAISATAGGNIINMLHLEKILKMVQGGALESSANLRIELLAGSLLAFCFAFIAMMSVGAYMLIMVVRVVVLWVLIVLSPLPYIFGVLQQTKGYADEWWSEFTKHVLVAPIAVFFLWLGFATLGSGDFAGPDLGLSFDPGQESQTASAIGLKSEGGNTSIGITEITTWENMANFIIAIAFLWIGLDQVQKSGVKGAEFAGKAKNFSAQNLFNKPLSGIGRGLGWGVKAAAWHAPFVGGRFWKRQFDVGSNAVKQTLTDLKIRQAEKAADRDKNGLFGTKTAADKFAGKYLFNRGLGELTGGLIGDSRARADKRAEDWKDTTERQAKILEESYGTGSASVGGQRKTSMTARLQQKEEFIAQKKEQKIVEERKKMEDKLAGMSEDEIKQLQKSVGGLGSALSSMFSTEAAKLSNLAGYEADTRNTASAMAKKELASDNVESRKKLRATDARDELEAEVIKKGNFEKDIMGTHRRNAESEEKTRLQNEDTIKRKGRARGQYFESIGDNLRATAATIEAAQKGMEETNQLLQGLNHTELINTSTHLSSELQKSLADGDESKAGLLTQQMLAAITTGFRQGFATGNENLLQVLKKNGKWDPAKPIDNTNRHEAIVSAITGEKITDDAGSRMEDVLARLKERVVGDGEDSEEEWNQYKRQLFNSFEGAAGQGDIGSSGVVQRIDNNGKTSYEFAGRKVEDGRVFYDKDLAKKQMIDSQNWYAENKVDLRNASSLTAFGKVNLEGDVVGFTDENIAQIKALFNGKNSNQLAQAKDALWKSIASVKVDPSEGGNLEQVTKMLSGIISSVQPEAASTIVQQIMKNVDPKSGQTIIQKIPNGEAVLQELVRNASSRGVARSGETPSTSTSSRPSPDTSTPDERRAAQDQNLADAIDG